MGHGIIATHPQTACDVVSPPAGAEPPSRRRFIVLGNVQGVGFRPFAHRVASRLQLAGTVRNFTGGVEIEVEGVPAAVATFGEALATERPAIALIEEIRTEDLPPTGQTEFVILPSSEQPGARVFISPDIALCADCERELLDPTDRRYRYPFLNCTNCGPRYTITARVPYDRPNTAMVRFEMCAACAREYHDLGDRRYHAQPVACPQCGPTLEFVGADGETSTGEGALQFACAGLHDGLVLALKGLGGFHLACDADNEAAVQSLRRRKGREQKPFAVMAGDLADLAGLVHLSAADRDLLQSPQRPIVLAPKRKPEGLAPGVAAGSADYGVMLPYTPLHRLLLADSGCRALVMTSGNLSEEPLCVTNEQARRRLGSLCDGFLWHDRDILVGCDDSVVRTSARGPIVLRRARGHAPFPVRLAQSVPPILALGGHLKNTVCLAEDRNAVLSQHLGDLENELTLEHFERATAHLQAVLQFTPQALACDAHPDYQSTRWARAAAKRLGLPLIEVQHHHAHIVSCLADNGVHRPVIGLACDGTGYGTDGGLWGCEVLAVDLTGFERVGHLRGIPLPGGEAAVQEPWRLAGAYLQAAYGPDFLQTLPAVAKRAVDLARWPALARMIERGLNCPVASSAGRLFDAVAALLGLCARASFEGQAAIALEAEAVPTTVTYPFALADEGGTLILDLLPAFRAMVEDLARGVSVGDIAGRFHETFARLLTHAAQRACEIMGRDTVALSGGTFQNRLLLERVCDLLEAAGLTVLHHRAAPPNDGGLALGQVLIADARLGQA